MNLKMESKNSFFKLVHKKKKQQTCLVKSTW